MRDPLDVIKITNDFSVTHKGIDMGRQGVYHRPVLAVDSGTVIYVKFQSTGGWVIHIKHSGYVSEYAHLQEGSVRVKVGDKVIMAQQIANTGKTGSGAKQGEHLHFGLCKGTKITYTNKDQWVNPLDYLEVYTGQTVARETVKQYGSQIRYHEPAKWTAGTYKLLKDKALRKSPNLGNNIKKIKECIAEKWAKSAYDKIKPLNKPNADAYCKQGCEFEISKIIDEGGRIWGKWGKTGNDHICLCNIDGTPQATKVK